jgi:hypothetical protein
MRILETKAPEVTADNLVTVKVSHTSQIGYREAHVKFVKTSYQLPN